FGRSFLRDPARADERARLRDELRGLDMRRVEPALEAVVRRRPIFDELARIRTPTLMLHGTEDRAIVPARAEQTARASAGARHAPVPGGGHTVSLEEPQAISRAIAAFVDGA